MKNYGTLADWLKAPRRAAGPSAGSDARYETNLNAFFDQVKAEIIEEAKQANVELKKRGLAPIEQVFMPAYRGKLCLTFGMALLCMVELNEAKRRIISVILGPPNRVEIMRREYLLTGSIAKPDGASGRTPEKHAVEQGAGRIASAIVSELLETGVGLMQNRLQSIENTQKAWTTINDPAALAEFWTSLGSLLRSYTAVHGMSDNRKATIDLNGETISVRHGAKWLRLARDNAAVTWTRENGSGGVLEFTDHGQLRGPDGEEAMDLVAETWARELMYDRPMEPA